jgi:hypothetical protein
VRLLNGREILSQASSKQSDRGKVQQQAVSTEVRQPHPY